MTPTQRLSSCCRWEFPSQTLPMSVLDTVKSICSQCLAYALVGITFTLMLSLTLQPVL